MNRNMTLFALGKNVAGETELVPVISFEMTSLDNKEANANPPKPVPEFNNISLRESDCGENGYTLNIDSTVSLDFAEL